jgi:hypothetical protein
LTTDRFGIANRAYSLDGNDNINLGAWNKPDTGIHTVTAWVYRTNAGSANQGVYVSNIVASPYDGLAAYIRQSDGAMGSYIGGYRYSSVLVPLNQWTFVRWEFYKHATAGYFKVSKNGEALSTVFSGNTSLLALIASNPQYIGMWAGSNWYFGGSISDVRIYNRALSDTEVLNLYNNNHNFSLSSGKNLLDTFNLSDVLTRIKGAFRTLTDSIVMSETYNSLKLFTRIFTDSIVMTTIFNNASAIYKVVTDSIQFTETISRSIGKSIYDTITIVDNYIKYLAVNVIDSIMMSDSVVKVFGLVRTFIDSISFSDAYSKVSGYLRDYIDNISITESLDRYLNGVKLIWTKLAKTTNSAYSKLAKNTSTIYTKVTKNISNWTKL